MELSEQLRAEHPAVSKIARRTNLK